MAGSAVEEIKARLDIGELVGSQVTLKRSGRSLKGLCPFHGEKTPSFYVFPESGNWKCFGCGEGGDVFTFVQKRENLDFVEALRLLANKAGVDLPERQPRSPEVESAEERARATLGAAERYFQAVLSGAAGKAARDYLARRGVNQDSVERFGLGFAPARGLLAHLAQAGFSTDEASAVGLAGQGEDGGRYEMFRERLMFPIRDASGRTLGFGGRTLGEHQPKYLNGPQTALFDKGGCLFALDLARAAIRQSGQAIIVEGYLDAVIAHQHGFQNVVATLGTALTERHLDLLGRRAREIVLALDADAAGQAAVRRGLEVAQSAQADGVVPVPDPGVRGLVRYQAVRRSQLKVLTLPDGLDPDDLIRRDPAQWAALAGSATPVVDYLLNRLGGRHDLTNAVGKREAVDEAVDVIRDLTDPVERAHYLQRLAEVVGLPESGLRQVLARVRPRTLRTAGLEQPEAPRDLPEAYALALYFLVGPEAGLLERGDLASVDARAIFELVTPVGPADRTAEQLSQLTEAADPALRPALAAVQDKLAGVGALTDEQRARELEIAGLKLRQERLRVEHQQVLAMLSESETSPPEPNPAQILARIAAQLRAIESALAARHGIGSLVWRSRQMGEVLGG